MIRKNTYWHAFLALISGGLAVLSYSIIVLLPVSWLLFWGVLGIWHLLIFIMYYQYRVSLRTYGEQIIFAISLALLLIIVEGSFARLFIIIVSGGVFLSLWRNATRSITALLSFEYKPWRRLLAFSWLVVVFCWLSALSAFHITFFPGWPMFVLALVAGLICTLALYMVLSLYRTEKRSVTALRYSVIGVSMAAVEGLLIAVLPYGYLVTGAIGTLLWYVLQVFTRFSLSRDGIAWRHQIWFLLGACLVLLLIIITARGI